MRGAYLFFAFIVLINPAVAQDLPTLLSQFQSEHDIPAKEAILQKITARYPDAGAALLKTARQTEDIDTKWLAIRGIGWLKYTDAAPFLKESLNSKAHYVRANSARALGEIRDISAGPDLIRTIAHEDDSGVIEQSALALQMIGDTKAVPVMKAKVKRTQSAQTRVWLLGAIETLDSNKDVPLFASFLFDQNQIVAVYAAHAIERFTGQDFGFPRCPPNGPCSFGDGVKNAQAWWKDRSKDWKQYPLGAHSREYRLDDALGKIALYPGQGYRSYIREDEMVSSLEELERRVRLLPKGTRLYWKPSNLESSGQSILFYAGQSATLEKFCRSHEIELIVDRSLARIIGSVIDSRGQPLKNIQVHAVSERTKMYMPTANSNANGEFVIPNLESGTYDMFGESDAAGYPNVALSFYSNEHPVKVTLENGATAQVLLILGPKAGVLSGMVSDRTSGRAIVSQHALRFIVRKISDPTRGIEFDGPPKFLWLIPPETEVTLEIRAECYEPLLYADPAQMNKPSVLRLGSGGEKTLNVQLEPDAKCAN